MLVETGHVQSTSQGRATILIRRAGSCKSCSARGACMTFGTNERTVEVADPIGADVGDEVQIGIRPARVVWASIIAYIIPVIGMVLGALGGLRLAPEALRDEYAAAGAFGALVLCFTIIWVFDRTRGDRESHMPVVLRVSRPAVEGSSAEGR